MGIKSGEYSNWPLGLGGEIGSPGAKNYSGESKFWSSEK